jgi:hypothetical protein
MLIETAQIPSNGEIGSMNMYRGSLGNELSQRNAGLVYQRLVAFREIYVVLTLVFPASRTVLLPATLAPDDLDTFVAISSLGC